MSPASAHQKPCRSIEATLHSCTPKRTRHAPRTDSAPQRSAPPSTCPGSSAKESPRTARCTRQTSTRDSCTPSSSRQTAHKKAESPGADKHLAKQTPRHHPSAPKPAALPAASPSPAPARVSPNSAPTDTKNPTKIPRPQRVPAFVASAIRQPGSLRWPFLKSLGGGSALGGALLE